MNGRMTFRHCACLTLAGVFILALAPGLSGVPLENASARDKGQVKSASRLVTSPVNQVVREINEEGGVASGALMELKWMSPQGSKAGPYPTCSSGGGTTGVDTADLTIPGAGPNGQTLWLGMFISGWGAQADLRNVQGRLDSGSWSAGLSVLRLACPGDDDQLCQDQLGTGNGRFAKSGCNIAPINDDTCAPAFIDNNRGDALPDPASGEGLGLQACAILADDLACGATVGISNIPLPDFGSVLYMATFVLSADQSLIGGPHTVQLIPPGGNTFMNDGNITLKVASATLSIETGSCCFGIAAEQTTSCEESVSCIDCEGRAAANIFRTVNLCPANGGAACVECLNPGQPDAACADPIAGVTGDNQCTDNLCDTIQICQNPDIGGWDQANDCCDPTNASFTAIDDDNDCTDDSCSLDNLGAGLGVGQHDNTQAGTPCDDGNACTFAEECGDKDGVCTGTDINTVPCAGEADPDAFCDGLVSGTFCCGGFCGICGIFPRGCCRADGSCELTCPEDCEASGGAVVAECLGDDNDNGLDDACVMFVPDPLLAAEDQLNDHTGGDYNRVGDFKMPTSAVASGQEVAIRVKLDRMYIDSDEDPANGCPVRQGLSDLQAFEGQVRYLGPPEVFDNNALTAPKWVGAKLQCTPLARDWSASALAADLGISEAEAGTIFYYGAEVVPCSIHAVQQATQGCVDSANEACFSDPLEVRTNLWGDIWPPFNDISFTDIGKVVDAFKSIPFVAGDPPSGAPNKWRSMLRENSPPFNETISFTDINKAVEAFKTIAYPEDGPTACP